MFRSMRRKKQQLSNEKAVEILENGKTGILAVNGDDGYPYTIPVNYVYYNNKIYIHSATEGHKIDAVKNNDKVSFCVIEKDEVYPQKLTTLYRSTVAFGKAKILYNDEMIQAVTALGLKYNPDKAFIEEEVTKALNIMCCIEITLENITGKESIELVNR